jgi:hypothetical protein
VWEVQSFRERDVQGSDELDDSLKLYSMGVRPWDTSVGGMMHKGIGK